LRDFLPSGLPRARIILFGYNSSVAFETSLAGVREQATNLLNRLVHKRENAEARPIVFIAHSLGGIIVKRALVEAKLDETYKSILDATYGIAFFGTPHRGSTFTKLGDVAAKVARTILHNPSNTFMESLRENSLFSETIVDDFRHQIERYQILSFYETQKTKNLGVVSIS
jgi:triacylglycerol esterase/lipase EstA (alpha/beta hydrolase family)